MKVPWKQQLSRLPHPDTGTPDEILLRLTMPPSTNRLYRRGRYGQLVLTKEAESYREYVKRELSTNYLPAISRFHIGLEVMYGIDIVAYFQEVENPGWFKTGKDGTRQAKTRYKKMDADNRIKFAKDCIVKMLGINDDSQSFDDHIRKFKGEPEGILARVFVIDNKDPYLRGGTWT